MPLKNNNDQYAVIVVGGGPAGLTAAIALSASGIRTALISKRPSRPDNRTTALLAGSVIALKTLGAWDFCAEYASPIRVMRIVDDTGRLWRAPEIKFEAHEIDLDAFGYNIENRNLIAALEKRARGLSMLNMIEEEVKSIVPDENAVVLALGNGKNLTAPLVVGADGRHSLCRVAAQIDISERDYRQVALTTCLTHTRPHHDTSTEFHTSSGPFTLVPLRGNRSSLVWVLDPQKADFFAALDDDSISAEIERASHSILGKIKVEPERGLFPLQVTTPERFADRRIALIGEAAHVIPPIGAQGLNLGLRDAATIAEIAMTAHRAGHDIGSDNVLARYNHMRRADVGSRTMAIDLFNRTLLTDFLPVQSLRGLGLYMLDRIGPLRRAVMREGIAPIAAQPRLMRGELP